MSVAVQPDAESDKLDPGVLKVAGVVVLGAIMSILDVTVVSVALPTFQREFDASYRESRIAQFRDKVSMVLDAEVDAAYPAQWIGKVTVRTKDGQTFTGRVDDPKGDPGNTLSRAELEHKTTTLGLYGNAAAEEELRDAIASVWSLSDHAVVPRLLPEVSLESRHG